MQTKFLTSALLPDFERYLRESERSAATVEKYTRCAADFITFLGGEPVSRETVLGYKAHVSALHSASGANGALAAVNSLLQFLDLSELKVRLLRVQSRMFIAANKELTRVDLEQLALAAAESGKARLHMVLQTLSATGIRVSELPYITVESLRSGQAEIHLKGKIRVVLLPTKLRARLAEYALARGIREGPIFITRGGKPLDRSNIWKALKALSPEAGVAAQKVFPHNLRHLFARAYYEACPDLAELAGILGHSNINTTRIYTATSGSECRQRLDSLDLLP